MSKKAPFPQTRRHVMIYDEDWTWLVQNYGVGSHGAALGISGFIKNVVNQRIRGMRAKANGELDRLRDLQSRPPESGPEEA